jgi:hypothetical protein
MGGRKSRRNRRSRINILLVARAEVNLYPRKIIYIYIFSIIEQASDLLGELLR